MPDKALDRCAGSDALIEVGDAEAAFAYYQRALEIREALLRANPKSELAARSVALALQSLTGFLDARGQPGDADAALAYYRRALAVCESLAQAEPDSEEAMRELSGCLNRLAHALARRGEPGDTEAALA